MDKHPIESPTVSTIPTAPPIITTPQNRRLPSRMSQLGRAAAYTSVGDGFVPSTRPSQFQLAAFDEARHKEPVIRNALAVIVRFLLASIGEYHHEDPKIEKFVQANLNLKLHKYIETATRTALWAGYYTAEPIWGYRKGPGGVSQVWLDDVIGYHPTQVLCIVNNHGRLTHGEKVYNTTYRSGIWVPLPPYLIGKKLQADTMGGYVRLPKSKVWHSTFAQEVGNPYGSSLLSTVLKYHLFKEVFMDLMNNALDRYGRPLVYVKVPNQTSQESIEEADGTTRLMSMQEVVSRELDNLQDDSFLVFTQTDKQNQPVELGSLTTGNNYGDTFEQAIKICDRNMMLGMNLPNLLMNDERSALGAKGASEAQWDAFQHFIISLHREIIGGFLDQVVRQLIQFNFDYTLNPLAISPGSIEQRPVRPSDIQIMSEALYQMTEIGLFNSEDEGDFNWGRDIMGMPIRKRKAGDRPRGTKLATPKELKDIHAPAPAASNPAPAFDKPAFPLDEEETAKPKPTKVKAPVKPTPKPKTKET